MYHIQEEFSEISATMKEVKDVSKTHSFNSPICLLWVNGLCRITTDYYELRMTTDYY